MDTSLSPFAPENLVSRDGFGHEQDGQPCPVGLQTMIYVMAIH